MNVYYKRGSLCFAEIESGIIINRMKQGFSLMGAEQWYILD